MNMCRHEVTAHCHGHGHGISRRSLLAALSAAPLCPTATLAQSLGGGSDRKVIDVHAHYQPPAIRALGAPGPMNAWSVERQLEDMDQAGVRRAMLSITTPGVPLAGDEAARIARESNEYAAMLSADHGDRFGFFSALPLDDLDNALKEAAYAFDTLGAHGVGLFTSYDGVWLGDSRFDPLFEELDRRKAIVYVHPTSAPCCARLMPEIPDTWIEYGTDTTRAIASYVYRGAAQRFPNVRMIWSHAGGTMPFLIERFDGADRAAAAQGTTAADHFRASVARFYYDIAQASNPTATTALRSIVPMERIVFGTDYPFRTSAEHVEGLLAGGVFNADELDALFHGNVEAGLPELLLAVARR
jgi:Predicted metal-dependent hydrolase of the TIM-barrel fold